MSVRHFKDRLFKTLSPLSPTFGSNVFMQELALRSRNRFRSDRRLIRDLPDGLALIAMVVQLILWLLLVCYSLSAPWSTSLTDIPYFSLFKSGAIAFLTSTAFAVLSSFLLYHFTTFLLHAVSLAVLGFLSCTIIVSIYGSGFEVSCIAGILTFIFLALYYFQGIRHVELSSMFIKSAGRICWQNLGHLIAVYAVYIPVSFLFVFTWCLGVWSLQHAPWSNWIRFTALLWCFFSYLFIGAFLRDFLQIWLSRVIYLAAFRHGGERATIVTSLTRRPSTYPLALEEEECDEDNDEFEEIKRQVTRESTWWCMGTACRSAFHLVLRGFSVHLWVLALIQVCAPKFGPPANPTCVLDVFHVPTAIYGTSFTKSRKFVGETMLNHGMDKISVDVCIRTFIYYMFTYGVGILVLLALQKPLNFNFRADFIAASALSIFSGASIEHFVVIFVAVAAILIVTSIDSVHMILCWAICETPTAVSHLEPQLMAALVSKYHARLDLKRFTGDRIEIDNELTQAPQFGV